MHGRTRILAALLNAALAGAAGADEPVVPTLDELLGLEPAGDAGPDRGALERKLTAREANEEFRRAVDLMGDAARRLSSNDPGVQTQRIQEDVLRRLDQIIEAAESSGGGGGSSSSSSSSAEGQSQPNQGTQARQSARSSADGAAEHAGPALSGVQMNPEVAPDGATWGNLPQRDREAVSQGVNDRYSALYRRLTELYYRRLAEQEGRE